MAVELKTEVSVLELPSKRLLTIPLPSEEGGDMMTMKEFFTLMEAQLSENVKWSRLMVGDRCIGKHTDSARPVQFFLLDNLPWFVHTMNQTPGRNEHSSYILVQTLLGKVVEVPVSFSDAIETLKLNIQANIGNPPEKQRLAYAGKLLEDGKTLQDYNIKEGSTIHLILRLRGGGCSPGVPFADVMNPAGPVRMNWSDSAPEWRRAGKGLCLEGKCTNRKCRARGQMVIMTQGHVEFDLISDAYKCKCPMCEVNVVPVTCAFNNCRWKIIGRKVRLGQPPEVFRTEWKEAGDAYERFSPEKSGEAHFLNLKILCKEQQLEQVCVVCGKRGFGDMKMATCGHQFHAQSCFDLATDKNCIECLATRSMSSYQKLFR